MKNVIKWLDKYGYNYDIQKSVYNDTLIFIENDFSDKIEKMKKYLNRYEYKYEYRANYHYIMIMLED